MAGEAIVGEAKKGNVGRQEMGSTPPGNSIEWVGNWTRLLDGGLPQAECCCAICAGVINAMEHWNGDACAKYVVRYVQELQIVWKVLEWRS